MVDSVPGAAQLVAWKRKKHVERFEKAQGVPAIAHAWVERYGLQVIEGPFKGMKYVQRAVGSSFVPKLLGSYECELHPILAQITGRKYISILDIGCAEGYYAIGLARMFPQTPVYAFDTDALGRRLCGEMARLNGVADNVTVGQTCRHEDLQRLLSTSGQKSLLICDCEGCEYTLLCPDLVPALANADIVVELHRNARNENIEISAQPLLKLFRATHDIQSIGIAPRIEQNYPLLEFLASDQQATALNEFRLSDQIWAFLQPKATCPKSESQL